MQNESHKNYITVLAVFHLTLTSATIKKKIPPRKRVWLQTPVSGQEITDFLCELQRNILRSNILLKIKKKREGERGRGWKKKID